MARPAVDTDEYRGRKHAHVPRARDVCVRIEQHRQLAQEHSKIGAAIRDAYPRALQCADRLAAILELRLGSALTDDEIAYLTLHVARVASDQA